jgi:hypothetical protein
VTPPPGALSQGLGTTARVAGTIASGVETGQGLYNLYRGATNWRDQDRSHDPAQQVSDGTTQLLHGGSGLYAALADSSVSAAFAGGLGAGTMMVNASDAYARAHGTFGADAFAPAASRGVPAQPAAPTNASGSEDAATQGAHTYQNVAASSYHWLHDHGMSQRAAIDTSDVVGNVAGLGSTFGHAVANVGHSAWDAVSSLWRD